MSLTPKKAAERMGVSPSLVYALCQEGRLPHARIGREGCRGKIVIAVEDLEAFIAACKNGGSRPGADIPLKHITLD